ncbi:MAG: VOC family protein [Mariprofundus sp.]|nr:VOC family protein [Mariprofundus sp.]
MFSFHHVALSVENLDASIAFYGVFGFLEVYRWHAEQGDLCIVHLKQGEALLELFCFKKADAAPDSSHTLSRDLPRIGIKHFALSVGDIYAAKGHLQQLGLAEGVDVVKGRTGVEYFFLKDPSGILLEVVQDKRLL